MRNLTGFFFLFRIRASKLYAELSRHPFKSNSFLEIDYFRQVRAINEPDEMQKKKFEEIAIGRNHLSTFLSRLVVEI